MIYTLEERIAIADTLNDNIRKALLQFDYHNISKEEIENIKHLTLDNLNIPRTNE